MGKWAAFESEKGEVYVGEAAWKHLNKMAGPTMAAFLDRYVYSPTKTLLEEAPRSLPTLTLRMNAKGISVGIGKESFNIIREIGGESEDDVESLPDDVDEETPGL